MVDISRAYQEVKTLPDETLAQELSNPSGMVPGYLVMAEMEDRKAIRTGSGGGPRTSMKDELLQGAPVQNFANGGMVGRMLFGDEEDPIFRKGPADDTQKYFWSTSSALSQPGWVSADVAPNVNMMGRNFAGMLRPTSTNPGVDPGAKPMPATAQPQPQKKKFAAGGIVTLMNPGFASITQAQNPEMQYIQSGRGRQSGLAGLSDLSSMVPTAPGTPGQPQSPPTIDEVMKRMA